ncbi:FG-GAP repeat protein [Candidatus Venteria ishoeyi]|uniref:FG-GAP repeat protein n=1 Tax=Candidatus Venteria ishoeyi TaxID=1899563 RepID=A0A1H6F9I7_9GAMM|nr:FG-GAP repeat protein [Candidatus Venteria ishoeyi]SEH06762.1 FG-GAP repeat protein [Candidatus Venteria ishoeyi]
MKSYIQKLIGTGLLVLSCSVWAITDLNIKDQGVVDLMLTGESPFNTFSPDFASSLVTADLNGDQVMDLIVSTPDEVSFRGISESGQVAAFFGGSSFKALSSPVNPADEKESFVISGTLEGENLGMHMTAGDFNQDGFDDLVIYAPKFGQNDEGPRLYVLYGKTDFSAKMEMPTHADSVFTHTHGAEISNTWNSMEVLNLATGDVNGDTVDDLVVADGINNVFHVVFGQAGQKWAAAVDLSTGADATLRPDDFADPWSVNLSNNATGLSVADLNADGISDIAVGVTEEAAGNLEKAGQVYVVYGKVGLSGAIDLSSAADIKISGALNKDQIGGSLAAGDLDNNGKADLIIGAPLSGHGQLGTTGIGRVFVVKDVAERGAALDLFLDADITLKLSDGTGRIGFYTGYTLSTKDLNNDGIADLTIGTPNAFSGSGTNGWVHVIYGATTLQANYDLDVDGDLGIYTPEPPELLCCGEMGNTLDIADMDNDGKADLLLGAPRGGLTLSNGMVHVLFDAANKQTGGVEEVVATLDAMTFQLYMPVVTVTGSPLTIWARINLIDPIQLIFELPLDGFGATTESSTQASNFDGNTGRLTIPKLRFSDILYTVDLVAVSVDPIRFQVDLNSLTTTQ